MSWVYISVQMLQLKVKTVMNALQQVEMTREL
jgi:hypothetical protein